jgi:hypothetical protein
MSPFAIAITVLGVAGTAGIMAYDIYTDGRFGPEPEVEPFDGEFPDLDIQHDPVDYKCKEWGHNLNPNLWCPNPTCPTNPDGIDTEPFTIAKKRLLKYKAKHNGKE